MRYPNYQQRHLAQWAAQGKAASKLVTRLHAIAHDCVGFTISMEVICTAGNDVVGVTVTAGMSACKELPQALRVEVLTLLQRYSFTVQHAHANRTTTSAMKLSQLR